MSCLVFFAEVGIMINYKGKFCIFAELLEKC